MAGGGSLKNDFGCLDEDTFQARRDDATGTRTGKKEGRVL